MSSRPGGVDEEWGSLRIRRGRGGDLVMSRMREQKVGMVET